MPKVRPIFAEAFSDALTLARVHWTRLAPEYRDHPEAARTRLAQIMVKLAGDGQLSSQEVTRTALRLMREG
jgi:hypothetical protein